VRNPRQGSAPGRDCTPFKVWRRCRCRSAAPVCSCCPRTACGRRPQDLGLTSFGLPFVRSCWLSCAGRDLGRLAARAETSTSSEGDSHDVAAASVPARPVLGAAGPSRRIAPVCVEPLPAAGRPRRPAGSSAGLTGRRGGARAQPPGRRPELTPCRKVASVGGEGWWQADLPMVNRQLSWLL